MDEFAIYCDKVSQNFRKLGEQSNALQVVAGQVENCLKRGKKILICGNGGSAADAQHIAAELVGRYQRERRPFPAIALTTDTSILTSIANDYEFDQIFTRQVQALGHQGDILIALSTSGHSPNIIAAVKMAKSLGIKSISLTGSIDNPLSKIATYSICVPSEATNHIQEMHIAIGHMICNHIESTLE